MKYVKSLLIIMLILVVGAGTAHARKPTPKKGKPAKAASKTGAQPAETCKAFAVMEATTGKTVEEANPHMRLAPASITKLMVADIIMDKLARNELQLTDKITVSGEAARMGGSQVFLQAGEVFTLEELMKAMMIASANDAAYAIAEHAGGSKEKFVDMMNERAKSLGMNDTEYHSPHGLPPSKGEKEDLTSPADLLILAKELLKYPKLMEWTSTKTNGFRNSTFTLNNTNKLLTKMPGVDGLKTGFFREAGFSIVASAKRNDLRLVAAVMSCPTNKIRDNFAMDRLKTNFAQFRVVTVVKKGEVIDKDVILEDGKYKKIKGVAKTGFSYPLSQNKKSTIRKEIVLPEKIKGEVLEGQKLGEILIQLDNETIDKIDIVSPVFVPKANLFTRLIRKLGLNI